MTAVRGAPVGPQELGPQVGEAPYAIALCHCLGQGHRQHHPTAFPGFGRSCTGTDSRFFLLLDLLWVSLVLVLPESLPDLVTKQPAVAALQTARLKRRWRLAAGGAGGQTGRSQCAAVGHHGMIASLPLC